MDQNKKIEEKKKLGEIYFGAYRKDYCCCVSGSRIVPVYRAIDLWGRGNEKI